MIPNKIVRNTQTNAGSAIALCGIDDEDMPHILSILRDTVYTDKPLAVLREYFANAWDANREAGRGDVPVKVVLPTQLESSLTIRDNGPGLSQEGIVNTYFRYGKSTKRKSNNVVGTLGIGAKCGFAYNDSFTVTSYNGGTMSVYHATLDESDHGQIHLFYRGVKVAHAKACSAGLDLAGFQDDEYVELDYIQEIAPGLDIDDMLAQIVNTCEPETGIEIKVPIRPGDRLKFRSTACRLFAYATPQPDINTNLPESRAVWEGQAGRIVYSDAYNSGVVVVMGCIPYKVSTEYFPETERWAYQHRIEVQVPMGSVDFVASREELEYSERTIAVLGELDKALRDEIDLAIATDVASAPTPWAAKLAKANHPLNKAIASKSTGKVGVPHSFYDGFTVQKKQVGRWGSTPVSFQLVKEVALYLNDTRKKAYHFENVLSGPCVKPEGDFKTIDWDAQQALLEQRLKDNGLEGIPVVRLSSLPLIKTAGSASSKQHTPVDKAKHRKKVFRLVDINKVLGHPSSKGWEAVDREPTKGDIWVPLDRFFNDDLHQYKGAQTSLAALGMKMPTVYGYKDTPKKPMGSVPGIRFSDWWDKVKARLANHPAVVKASRILSLDEGALGCSREGRHIPELPADHPINIRAALQKEHRALSPADHRQARRLRAVAPVYQPTPAEAASEKAFDKYPLLDRWHLDSSKRPHAIEYILLIDNK